ncbi:hypothetical protein WME79_46815 [Sorangium sp. So ce726]|uniref:hypothetical protein n=1 Tax=Sorangium sp. So ce726 TaxID=3133319 RepID=UPI003F635E9E
MRVELQRPLEIDAQNRPPDAHALAARALDAGLLAPAQPNTFLLYSVAIGPQH